MSDRESLDKLYSDAVVGQRRTEQAIKDNFPALYWAMRYHRNNRGERMDFTNVPYLVALYTNISRDKQMVVEKSVQCFPGSTLVVTPNGYRPISKIGVGNLVLTHAGRYRPVTQVYTRDVEDCPVTSLRADSSATVVATAEHPFLQYAYNRYRYHHTRFENVFGGNPEWKNAKDINAGSFLVRPTIPKPDGSTTIDISNWVSRSIVEQDGMWLREKWGQKWFRKVVKLDESFGALVGLYLAEGWVNKSRLCFGFHIKEKNLEQIVRKAVGKLLRGKESVHTYESEADSCRRVFVSSFVLSEVFGEMFGKSCENKHIPDFLLRSNPQFLRGVLRAVYAGDGTRNGSQSRIATVSPVLAQQLRFIAGMFGIFGLVSDEHPQDKKVAYRFTFPNRHGKYRRSVRLGNTQTAVRVRKADHSTYTGTVYNLEVAEDHTYVAEDYVVHNCGLSELFIVNSHLEAAKGLTVMYVLPKYELRNRFVNNRIYKLHKRNVHYSKMLQDSSRGGVYRTSLMHFGDGTISYVGSNVESEFIEMPIDSAYVDEKDRCNLKNLLLLPDRYTASPYRHHREISNPTIEGFGIDARYQESSQGQWFIKCPHCGRRFVPDFFLHVVNEIDTGIFVPRDPNYDPEDEQHDLNLICECGKPVNRLSDGEWVHEYPRKIWKGYRISKVLNKHTPLLQLYKKWVDAQGNESKKQVFYNSDLGLPFSSEGSKITVGGLNRCVRDYAEAKPEEATENPRIIGIDVGAELHYVVRDVVREKGVLCTRLLACGRVPSFPLLMSEVLAKWCARIEVIDALPEIHEVQNLKSKRRNLFSSYFVESKRSIAINRKEREIGMNRTAILDYVKQGVDQETSLLPKNAEFLDHGQYYKHMMASTRVLNSDEENPEKSAFEWVHTAKDHYFLAEAYCRQALFLLPNVDEVIGFFRAHTGGALQPNTSFLDGMDPEEKDELERKAQMTPEHFLNQLKMRNK